MDAKEVEEITRGFHAHFRPHKSSSQHLSLPWYRVSQEKVLLWLQNRRSSALPVVIDAPGDSMEDELFFSTDSYILSGFDGSLKKRKAGEG
jgi:hypothetical protein